MRIDLEWLGIPLLIAVLFWGGLSCTQQEAELKMKWVEFCAKNPTIKHDKCTR